MNSALFGVTDQAASRPDPYALPGPAVFPEGITEGPDGTYFVGSTTDGTVFRIQSGLPEAEVWLSPGGDGRTELLGLAMDSRQRLVACGGSTGDLFVYDAATAALVARRNVPVERTLLNDVTTDQSAAYVTDSARPVIWRLPLDVDGQGGVGEPEVLVDLAGLGADEHSFLNGIVGDSERGMLLVAAQAQGELWRVETASGVASRVDLNGHVFAADGLLLRSGPDGSLFLLGAVNEGETRETVTFGLDVMRLARDWASAELVAQIPLPVSKGFDVPTTIAWQQDRVLVVCGQVMHPDEPRPPFLVKAVEPPCL
ncbi:MAG: SMP-30/gluconolactonase/LRE family protein [Oryzihumus sp.]